MPAVIEKALDYIGGMNTSASTPHSMDESTAKGIFKYLNELGYRRVQMMLRHERIRRDGILNSPKKWLGGLIKLSPATVL